MDSFEAASFPTALPSTFAFVEETAPAEERSQHPLTFQDAPSGFPGIREMTRQQWEAMKPLIQRVYIDENKPFPYLAKILHDEYGFEPTKRQFSRKIIEWGFRKNVSRFERRSILGALPRHMDEPVPDLQDRRLRPGKLKNWRRRYRNEVVGVKVPLPQRSNGEAVEYGAMKFLLDSEAQMHQASEAGGIPAAFSIDETLNDDAEDPAPVTSDDAPVDPFQDRWPFDWSKVDVPGSPGLSRLFKGLEIESADPISPLSLDTPESADATCLSNLEVQELFKHGNKAANEDLNQVLSSREPRHTLPFKAGWASRCPQYLWRNIDNIFFGHATSPLMEIYVFPHSPSPKALSSLSRMPTQSHLETQERELEIKLAKLKKQFQAENPAVLGVMEDLALVYHRLARYSKAEVMFRSLVDLFLQNLGPNNVRTLNASINLIFILVEQSRLFEARSLNSKLLSAVLKNIEPNHSIAIQGMRIDAAIALCSGQMDKGESLQREILQIQLTFKGPRHTDTILAMKELGRTITSEKLVQTSVQLLLNDPVADDEWRCAVLGVLSYVTFMNRTCEESYNISMKAVEMFMPKLGPKHKSILKNQVDLAWYGMQIGKLTESERLLRGLLLDNSEEWTQSSLSDIWECLAEVLQQMGRVEEAGNCYEKAFAIGLACYGAEDTFTTRTCRQLARCYQKQGRYDDALKLYHQLIDKIRDSGQDRNGTIAELELEISYVKEEQEESSSYSPYHDEESNGWKLASEEESGEESDEESDEEQDGTVNDGGKMQAGEQSEEEDEKMEMEDWMTFIHDNFTAAWHL